MTEAYSDCKQQAWSFPVDSEGRPTDECLTNVLLQEIRDELFKLNRVFACRNFLDIPFKLDKVVKNTTKPKRKRAAKK